MARVKSLVGLVVCVLLEWEAVSGHIRLERPCGEDNLSCPRIGNLSQIPLQCFTRQELCNGIDFCSSGTDEGTDIASLKCDPERQEDSLFQCTPDVVVSIFALCDGVNDCGLGNDETTTLCENKCLGPYNGGCPSTKVCKTSEFDISCECFPGFIPDPNNSTECIRADDPCLEDDGEEDSRSSRGRSHSTSPRSRSKRMSRSSRRYSTTPADVRSECRNKSRTSKKSKTGSPSPPRVVQGAKFRNSHYWARILRTLYGLSF